MKNWKTYTGALIVAASAVLQYLGYTDYATLALTIGGALGVVGVGSKLERIAKQGE